MDRARFSRPQAISGRFATADHPHQHIENWVRRRTGNIDHERRVLQIAGSFFDMTRDLHALGRRSHWALCAGALIHDVGRSVDPAKHERIGAEMILSDPTLRLPIAARRWLAYLTLYHRGPVPELGDDQILRPTDDRDSLLTVLGLLRAADTLDSRSLETPRLVMVRRGRRIQVNCFVSDPSARAQKAFCRPKKYRLMEQTLGCSVIIELRAGDARLVTN
jgi:exopolyphosphatase/pppGpp-phosphohydrolase